MVPGLDSSESGLGEEITYFLALPQFFAILRLVLVYVCRAHARANAYAGGAVRRVAAALMWRQTLMV